ncbi:unnamed protein product [Mesocestoides corti]|nr:unnamed protein product [Mesocestoides corti]
MSKSRVEGLISTFPKLADPGKQHTFVETDSVRYVYQPLERMYVLLITTKASNILEDLETLRLFARVIPEYARGSEASDIVENAFQIIFAFDEIVALGYRESVTLSQIRTFTEMDSHEEKMFNAVRENQMQEARELSKRKARELHQARVAAAKQGLPPSAVYNSFSSGKMDSFGSTPSIEPAVDDHSTPLLGGQQSTLDQPVRRGMQLGSRGGHNKVEMEKLTDMLRAEGPVADPVISRQTTGKSDTHPPVASIQNLHIRVEEKLTVLAGRDGGLESMELAGVLQVRAGDEEASRARIRVDVSEATTGNAKRPPASMQTHPNLDKRVFQTSNWLQIKAGGKVFPIDQEVGVLRWRLQTHEETALPVLINCWPNEINGGFEVNVEYELQDTSLSLQDFCITIPLPTTTKPPIVGACDGDYEVDSRRGQLVWTRPLVDTDNATGSLDFTIKTDRGAKADLFFPVQLNFTSTASYCGVKVTETTDADESPIKFSYEANFHPDRYEVA